MRRKILISILAAFCLVAINAQEDSKKVSKAEKKLAEYEETKTLVETKVFDFEASKANPQGGGSIDLSTNPNHLKIRNDSVIAHMPYFGRAYSAPYGGDGGIKFEGPMKDFDIAMNDKKQSISVKFSTSTSTDSFNCTLEITRSKYATLSITSRNRAFISYYGRISELKQ